MEFEVSLSCSNEPSTDSYLEPDQSIPYHTILSLSDPFKYCHPPTPWSFQWALSFWLSQQYPICSPILSHLFYMPCPSHPPSLAEKEKVAPMLISLSTTP
jgi:hypothetical protein